MQMLTSDEFKASLPANFKKSVNQELIDTVNNTISNPEVYETYRDNLVGFSHVLQQGKFRLDNYVDAVRYVSFKMMNMTNKEAYHKTFPDKIKRFLIKQVETKDVASYISAYNKSKLVNLILEQTLTPSWIVNQDLYQSALNVQADLMLHAKSEKVRTDAANSLLTQLKQPETQKLQLDVGIKEHGAMDALRNSTLDLVAEQRKMIQSGAMVAEEVAHSKILGEAEYTEVSDE
jgi:hypothetical protein